ncbi:hypothetical protein ABZ883_05565 [Streptomyces sp. NPDC046977]|uniref:hypothetical protein n=1 Tax=Streptomyces sp. NPDC046977 TaxID=3154703 RepID=UPI0033EFA887
MRGIRAAATVAGLVACAALAGCGAPAPAGEPLAGPEPVPVASPTRAQRPPSASATPVAPAATGTASRATAPRRTPAAPPRTRSPVPPSAGATTASPRPELPDLPDLSRTAPSSSSAPPTPRSTPTGPASSPSSRAASPVPSSSAPDAVTALHIGDWSAQVVRGDQETVDACRDAVQWDGPALGSEDGYALRTAVVVGHDYCGFQRFATLPIGTVVTATTPRGTFTYRVYAHHTEPGRGAPSHGLYWGDLTLQSCVGPNTGFSYLRRE